VVKELECEAEESPLSTVNVKQAQTYVHSPICLHDMVLIEHKCSITFHKTGHSDNHIQLLFRALRLKGCRNV